MKLNASLNSDGYKLGHGDMYAAGTSKVYSNLTPRSDKIYARTATRFYDGKVVFFGAQGALQEIVEMWDASFFKQPKAKVLARFKRRVDAYLGEGVISTARLAYLHDLGYLPLEVKTLDEGSKVPMGIPVLTITNTDPECFWLVNYLETVISNLTWKPTTNATIAAEYKAMLKFFAETTGCYSEFGVSVQAHDFSCRGMSGPEDAARSGAAHLTSFIGTDTLSAMDYIEDYYGCDGLLAISVPATEHAVSSNNIISIEQRMLQNGITGETDEIRLLAETQFMSNLLKQYPTGFVSYVADSYDYWSVLTRVLPALKDQILARDGKLVIRPDSGDPVKVITGYTLFPGEFSSKVHFETYLTENGSTEMDQYEAVKVAGEYYETNRLFMLDFMDKLPEHEVKGSIQILWEIFGGTTTETGHKLLDSHIGLIYGDSITTGRCLQILERLAANGFASCNVVFGVGSYTYQCNTRDTFGFAVKATYSVVNGEPVNIFKDPKTDSKKKSAKGLLAVIRTPIFTNNGDLKGYGNLELIDEVTLEEEQDGLLVTRFKDGTFFNAVTLDIIRQRLA